MKINVEDELLQKELKRILKELNTVPKELSKEWKSESLELFNNNDWDRKVDGTKATLIKSGDMKKGIKSTYNSTSVTMYDKVKYATYHQYGTSRLPSRKFIIEDEEIISKLYEELILKIFKTV